MCKTKLSDADNHRSRWSTGHSTQVTQRWSASLLLPEDRSSRRPQPSTVMSLLLLTVLSSLLLQDAESWSVNVKYAVNCPDRCNAERCGATQRCTRTVLDDCGCCQVCAAGRGEHCYRTVSGMHGVKCGPGLFCEFYKDEDDYGDEYGICKGKHTFNIYTILMLNFAILHATFWLCSVAPNAVSHYYQPIIQTRSSTSYYSVQPWLKEIMTGIFHINAIATIHILSV